MPGRYFIKTFGCQMNEYDSARMADVLALRRWPHPPPTTASADVLLMNTCSVREKAQEKVFSLLGEWRALKQQRPDLSSASAAASRARKARRSRGARRSSTSCSDRRPCTGCRR